MADTTQSGIAGTTATAPSAVARIHPSARARPAPIRAGKSPSTAPAPSGPATFSAEDCAEFLHSLEGGLPADATSYLVTLGGDGKRIVQPVAPNCGMVDLNDGQEVVALLCTHPLATEVLRSLYGYCSRALSSRGEGADDYALPMDRHDGALHAARAGAAEAEATRFQSHSDESYLAPGTWNDPPALLVNPLASLPTLRGAAHARVDAVVVGLGVLLVADANQDSTPEEMVMPLVRLVEEAAILLKALDRRLPKGGAA